MITKFMQEEEGATAIEYGLIAALIAVVIITALIAVGSSLNTTFTTIEAGISKADSAASAGS
jgi:pilus assembly protein Flp/PilA